MSVWWIEGNEMILNKRYACCDKHVTLLMREIGKMKNFYKPYGAHIKNISSLYYAKS